MAQTLQSRVLTTLAIGLASVGVAQAFDITRYDNNVVYWGQNSYGATHASDEANWQKTLSYYCQDDSIDVIPISFINQFFGTGGAPVLNLANTCNPTDNATFSGTGLANCQSLATDITTCQAAGKVLTLSLGGGGASAGFTDDTEAETFADTIWNDFLGGSSSTRPFGTAVLDGVDLDIEQGGSTGYVAFLNRLQTYFASSSKKYYISAAPQCVFPDANLGSILNAVAFDMVYVQFYNNQCGLQAFNNSNGWNYGVWDIWAKGSLNPDVKVYVGAPASSTAAGGGYTDPTTFAAILKQTRDSFPSFGGAMLWDASQAYVNNRYDLATKNALVANGGTGFTYPACSAPTFVAGTAYNGGSLVTYESYIWEAKWWSDNTPNTDTNGDWNPVSACSGTGTSTSSSTSSSSSSSPTSTGGDCAGVAAWVDDVAYLGGQQVTYNGHLYTANWWTENMIPGVDQSGAWTDDGACTAAKRAVAPKPVPVPMPGSVPTAKRVSSRFFRF